MTTDATANEDNAAVADRLPARYASAQYENPLARLHERLLVCRVQERRSFWPTKEFVQACIPKQHTTGRTSGESGDDHTGIQEKQTARMVGEPVGSTGTLESMGSG